MPGGFILAALVCGFGRDDVAACARHDRAVVVPAVGTTTAAVGAVIFIVRLGVAGVFAALVQYALEAVGAGGGIGRGAETDRGKVGDFAVPFYVGPALCKVLGAEFGDGWFTMLIAKRRGAIVGAEIAPPLVEIIKDGALD